MRDRDLCIVLLVKAFEDQDQDGSLLPMADRTSASREAARSASVGLTEPANEARQQALLVHRSRILFARLAARHPSLETIVSLAASPRWLGALLALAGFAAGVSLSLLDGPRRIEVVLSWPLLAFVAWNLAVYAWPVLSRLLGLQAWRDALPRSLAQLPRVLAGWQARRSRRDRIYAGALGRFLPEWFALSTGRIVQRLRAALHLSAAAAGVGLVAGLLFRGLVLEYRAGWETTFLSPDAAAGIVAFLYGPASILSGIPLPDAERLSAMRWPAGEPAAPWFFLIMLTVAIWVIVPRLAFFAHAAWKGARPVVPAPLHPYFRSAFAGIDGISPRTVALVMPYAHAPAAGAFARLIAWLPQHLGVSAEVQAAEPVPYGEEEQYVATLSGRGANAATVLVLPFSLASTPEPENHGAVLSGTRDWLASRTPSARLLVVVDEGPFRARVSAPERLEERRQVWRTFLASHGLEAVFVDLTA